MVAYILEGELSVYYEGIGVKTFSQGSSFVETRNVNHYGENAKRSPVRILVVYAGADGSNVLPASSETGSCNCYSLFLAMQRLFIFVLSSGLSTLVGCRSAAPLLSTREFC